MSVARSRFMGNTAALAASTLLTTALTLAQMKILAAHLPLAMFGLFASLRGLSLLVSMLAANGLPQVLVRFLPEHAAHGTRSGALRVSIASLAATAALCGLLFAGVVSLSPFLFRHVPQGALTGALLAWFGVTTAAVALKLVLYGGFNGLRRFGSQTVLETTSLAAQVAWIAAAADSLTLTRLFQITGVTSAAAALAAIPSYLRLLRRDVVPVASSPPPSAGYVRYWSSALGLSIVALAFTDVDRWVLSNVLALEALSLFHVASRVARLANRVIAIPVLAFQPEATRVQAEGRREFLEASARAFFKASVALSVLAAGGIAAYADPLVEIVSSRDFLGARVTLWLLTASIPVTAMTAPLTAIMKALDGVREAFYCDLAWALAYLGCMVTLAGPLGVEGAGVAQLGACALQVVLAFRLARVRPSAREAVAVLGKCLACGAAAFAAPAVAFAAGAPLLVPLALAPPAVWLYLRMTRWTRVFSQGERALLQRAAGRRVAALSGWLP